MKQVDLWELNKISVNISESFLEEIKQKIKENKLTKRKLYYLANIDEVSLKTFSNILKESHLKKYFFPLNILIKIIKTLEIDIRGLNKNIISYKTSNGSNIIKKPILPFRKNAITAMLLAHHIGDGTAINIRGRQSYFGYRQFNTTYKNSYVKKLNSAFGKINFVRGYSKKSTRPYCPASCSEALCKLYNVSFQDFLSKTARAPKLLLKSTKEEQLAFLIGIIIDDGNADSTCITIGLKNQKLIGDLGIICKNLKYKNTITLNSEGYKKEYGYLYILKEGIERLYLDYKSLTKKYPIITLDYKGEQIKRALSYKNRKIYKTKGNKEIIYELIKKEVLTVNQISKIINMTRQGVRYHIHKLEKEKKIELKGTMGENNNIYGIKKC
jgi:hypothetical protein